jgi:drug/metabolite transporter (DMT)-like permease
MPAEPILLAVLSAVLFGLSAPLAKILLRTISPPATAGLLYLGAFLGLSIYAAAGRLLGRFAGRAPEPRFGAFRRKDVLWLAGSILCGGVAGPLCLMEGLKRTSGLSASLLLSLEGAATAVLAVFLFDEQAGAKIWLALSALTAAGALTLWDPARGGISPVGPALVFLAMGFWGLDNNITRSISDKNPVLIAAVKGLAAGTISSAIAFASGSGFGLQARTALGLAVGAFGYGLSLVLFIRALGKLGAFRAGAFFSLAPFVGSLSSLIILHEPFVWTFWPAAALVALGTGLLLGEKHAHLHDHPKTVHAHEHAHGDLHHAHRHVGSWTEPHAHEHVHEPLEHSHPHRPDTDHRHRHR